LVKKAGGFSEFMLQVAEVSARRKRGDSYTIDADFVRSLSLFCDTAIRESKAKSRHAALEWLLTRIRQNLIALNGKVAGSAMFEEKFARA
jgi:hypothetical protein